MRISIGKVKTARDVLKAIQKMVRNRPKGRNYLYLEHYQNGREHGFIIGNFPTANGKESTSRWVAFSENRNSDHIVVYPSPTDRWGCPPMQGMDDKAWENRVFFGPGEAEKAAKFCLKHLLV